MAWDPASSNPNIDAITMTYGYMRNYEDRVRRAVNTPDRDGPLRALAGRHGAQHPGRLARRASTSGMKRAVAGAEREQREGASGKWVAHWKMVHIVRPVWEQAGQDNQLGREFPRAHLHRSRRRRADRCSSPRRAPCAARATCSASALQYGNAFGQGFQAAALKPADFFGNDDVLYLMEDMATGEIRLSILWEWLHKAAPLTEDDAGDRASRRATASPPELFERLLDEEYAKLLAAGDRDVHDDSKTTTLPIAREIVEAYVTRATSSRRGTSTC